MSSESPVSSPGGRADRVAPYSEEAEKGVLGSILLDSATVMDICIEQQLVPESFYVPAHRLVYEAAETITRAGGVVDVVTVADRLKSLGRLDDIGGPPFIDRLVDSTPTAAHAAFYIDIVRQKHMLRCVIDCARQAELECYSADDSADQVLSRVEQSFLDITEKQHGQVTPWNLAVRQTMEKIEQVITSQGTGGLRGIPTGFANLDHVLQGLRSGEMIVLAARPSMGKTSLAMNIAENIALGRTSDHVARPVGIFSLEMSMESLVMRMLCTQAEVPVHTLTGLYVSSQMFHSKITQAASVLMKAPIFLDDTGGLDVTELRARARRMRKKHGIELIVIDYLQLVQSREFARQGKQQETANVSGQIKAMAKELKVPVIVLSQLSRRPEDRERGKPKLSDLRDSGAIEQDADVVCLLRRPAMIDEDEEHNDETLAIVDVAKQRNGPTNDDIRLNFESDFTRFRDRAHGTDGIGQPPEPGVDVEAE